jgi:hypothetical protein
MVFKGLHDIVDASGIGRGGVCSLFLEKVAILESGDYGFQHGKFL